MPISKKPESVSDADTLNHLMSLSKFNLLGVFAMRPDSDDIIALSTKNQAAESAKKRKNAPAKAKKLAKKRNL